LLAYFLNLGEAMRRRDFINAVAGTAAVWPLVAHAQQTEQVRRIGVLMNRTADDPGAQALLTEFQKTLQQLGWSNGANARVDIRWGANDADLERKYAAELAALAPEVIFAAGTQSVAPLQRITRSVPIVFTGVADPVGAGFVDNLARPGGKPASWRTTTLRS
jgi:putative ABC transport system substrate-binding protein